MASTTPSDATGIASSQVTGVARAGKPTVQPKPVPVFMKVARVLGSIQLALSAGFIFTVAMIIGTCLESWYSASIAQELVYNSWWFLLLMGLLATCIFFAAVKKWPWKKHQTGFLITHVGLLTMLAGGVLNIFWGVDANMSLIDNKAIAERMQAGPNKSDIALLPHETVLTVYRMETEGRNNKVKESKEISISPGPLPWGTALADAIPIPGMIRGLSLLANPFPRSIDTRVFNDDVRLEVLAHLPHTRIEPLEAAGSKEFGFPAIKLEINTKETGHNRSEWIALTTDRDVGQSPTLSLSNIGMWAEFLGRCPSSLIDEFTKPPSEEERGTKGQLVFALAGKKYRISVADQMGKTVPLGDSGWKIKLESYKAQPNSTAADDAPELPVVNAVVFAPDGKETKYQITGRLAVYLGPLDHLQTPVYDLPEGLPAVWYHPPDLRYAYDGKTPDRPHIKMMLQFAQTTDNKLYYRSMLEQNGKLQLESSGPVPGTGIPRTIWDRHAGSFIIEEHLPHAKTCTQRVVPVAQRPGLVSESNPSALLCRLTIYKTTSQGEKKPYSFERWLPLNRTVRFTISGTHEGESFREPFQLGYNYKSIPLGFEIELTRAESQVDPGTNRSATYSSFVKVYDKDLKMNGKDFMITMNEPLDHRGYKIYQSQFENAGSDPVTKKPIARSGFTIGRDPGLWLKYLGTAMLGLGIATMYYMKAYFITGKRKTLTTA